MSTREIDADIRTAEAPSRPWAGRLLIGYFVVLIAIVPIVQLAAELRRRESVQELDVFHQFPTIERLQSFERALEDNSKVAGIVRGYCQWAGVVLLRAGNQEAVIGEGQNIFYRTSLDSVTAPGFMHGANREGHPVDAIVSFRDSLRGREVDLVLLIVPGKETIHPEWLSRRRAGWPQPPVNRDTTAFLEELERQGVSFVDPTEVLWRSKPRGDLYLRQDTHWTPEGLDIVADCLVERLADVDGETCDLRAEPVNVSRRGDLFDMLKLPALPVSFEPQTVTIRRVVRVDTGEPLEPDGDSPIVLLGDSFTNVYSTPDMGWGDHAGLGEQLALRLGRTIDIIAQNDGGVNTARATLVRSPGGIDAKKLVIWQFAARDLVASNGEWKRIDIVQ